jgi:hypothetical protein
MLKSESIPNTIVLEGRGFGRGLVHKGGALVSGTYKRGSRDLVYSFHWGNEKVPSKSRELSPGTEYALILDSLWD